MVQKFVIKGDDRVHVIEIHQHYIDLSTMAAMERDPDWTFTDSHGHLHTAAQPSATLKRVVDGEPHWCQDCRDEHEPDDHLECVDCGEVVEPGMRHVAAGMSRIAGLREILIDGEPATEEEAKALIARYS